MDKYQEISGLLHSQNIEFIERGEELQSRCIFNGCDENKKLPEARLYINKHNGTYLCHRCGEKGNLVTLQKHLGVEVKAPSSAVRTVGGTNKDRLAAKYHSAMPIEIWHYLRTERLLRDKDIVDYQLGFLERADGRWITIPVTDMADRVQFFKLRRDPAIPKDTANKYMSTGGPASIFNAQVLKDKPEKLVICEGEFDCMVLTSMGVPAISSTAGAKTFKDEWLAQLDFVRDYYIAFDSDDAGQEGADGLIKKLASSYPNSSIMRVVLPSHTGEKVDITDFFKHQLGTIEDLFEPSGKFVKHVAGMPPINIAELSEISLADVADTLALTIKHDDTNKLITFLAMLSAYTDSSQINVSFNAPSSSGKTYITTEVAKLFPAADKIELSGASPTSFFYGASVYDKERDAKLVSLERKIMLLYEQPNPLTQEKLRPVLSHDQRELNFRMTNKDKKGSNRAELIIIRGFPATVFCSAGMRLDEQEATRAILLSPEATEDKLKEGVHLQTLRGANEADFEARLESRPERIALKNRILAIKREHVDDIVISQADAETIEQRFVETFPKLKARNMRDIGHLLQLIKAITLLNVWHRRQEDGTIIADQSDINQAFALWNEVIESQDWGVPPAVMNFYKEIVLSAYFEKMEDPDLAGAMKINAIGLSRDEICTQYQKVEESWLNDEVLRKQYLPQLQSSGLITQSKPLKGDKRSIHVFPKWFPKNNKGVSGQNNIGKGGGETVLTDEVKRFFFGHK